MCSIPTHSLTESVLRDLREITVKLADRRELFVRALPVAGDFPKLPKRQQEVWNIIEERRELPLTELLELAETTAATARKLEDRGLIEIAPQISERDPYAREHILPSQPLPLNPAQASALAAIKAAKSHDEAKIRAALDEVLETAWYIFGKECRAFEEEFAAYCQTKHCIGVGCGLDALTLTLKELDIGPGDEVICPTFTFFATAGTIGFLKKTPAARKTAP